MEFGDYFQMTTSRVESINETVRNAWANLVEAIQKMKETAVEVTDLRIISEHLQIIFRDESKFSIVFQLN